MAVYRNVHLSFWTDPKVEDDFTPEDKYFYLYLLTNAHTNLCGCYETSIKQMSNELGYNKDTVERLLERFEDVHKVIKYSKTSKQVIILNWSKYNWTDSPKLNKPLIEQINNIKNKTFQRELLTLYNQRDTVSIPYPYHMDTTDTVTVINNNIKDNNIDSINNNTKEYKYYSNKELDNVFIDYIKMRNLIKHPMSERAITLAMNKLEKLAPGDDEMKIKIIDQSIYHSWQGLFKLKDDEIQVIEPQNNNGSSSSEWQ